MEAGKVKKEKAGLINKKLYRPTESIIWNLNFGEINKI